MSHNTIIEKLTNIVGEQSVKTDTETLSIYGTDKTQRFSPNPLAIVFPQNELQIISLVQLANQEKIAIVPSGGRTGYSGGAVAINHEIVISLDKMNHILEYNADDKTVRCEAGVITKQLQDFALEHNLFYPVDFASSGSSQLGGNIATNAGGIKVIRYGSTRNWIYGLKVVTGNGDVLELNYGLIKNSSGYDLRHLFIGSEGTLGIITEATIKLTTMPTISKVALFAIPDKKHLTEILNIFSSTLLITAFEFFSEPALKYVIVHDNITHPFRIPHPFYILLEFDSNENYDNNLINLCEKCVKDGLISDAIVSSSLSQNKILWRYRENISMSLLKYFPYKFDIAVTPSKVASFIEKVDLLFNTLFPQMETIWFGHVGDGNLHLNILKPEQLSKDDFLITCENISREVYTLIQTFHGSVSAEHGIGLLKKPFLSYGKNSDEINYMRNIKHIFDRNNIMNPGKLI